MKKQFGLFVFICAAMISCKSTDPLTKGSLTREEIEGVIRADLPQIKACYEKFLPGKLDLGGKVVTKFSIGPDGLVKSSAIESSELGSAGCESCISGAILRWKFPMPRGGGEVNVNYPFSFQSQK